MCGTYRNRFCPLKFHAPPVEINETSADRSCQGSARRHATRRHLASSIFFFPPSLFFPECRPLPLTRKLPRDDESRWQETTKPRCRTGVIWKFIRCLPVVAQVWCNVNSPESKRKGHGLHELRKLRRIESSIGLTRTIRSTGGKTNVN